MVKINGVVPLQHINNTLAGLDDKTCKYMLNNTLSISLVDTKKQGRGLRTFVRDIGKCRVAFKGNAIRIEGELEEKPETKPYIRLAYQLDDKGVIILSSIRFVISENPGILKESNWEIVEK